MNYLYHTDVYMPGPLRRPIFEGVLRYGSHAKYAKLTDRYGEFDLPRVFRAEKAWLIEAEYDDCKRKVVKQVWRQQLDEHRDLVLVINRDGFVRTAWINLRSDLHKSLDTSRYVQQ